MPQTTDLYASVDLGGTKIACGFATGDGRIMGEGTIPTDAHEGPEAVLNRVGGLVTRLSEEVGRQPTSLSMGVPGLVDLKRGVTRLLPNLPTQWRDVPVRDMLSPRVGCPVYLLNDVRMATLGELTYGHGRDGGTMVFFALGTGIGGGVVVDGRLRLGPLGMAGELGHQTVCPDGPLCGSGIQGCLEAFASGPAITAEGIRLLLIGQAPRLQEIVQGDLALVTPKTMAEAAETGDAAVREAIIRAAEYLGISVANAVVLLHPDLIVLGGGVAGIGPLLFDTVAETMHARVRVFPVDDIRIAPSLLGERAGMLGGIALGVNGGLVPE